MRGGGRGDEASAVDMEDDRVIGRPRDRVVEECSPDVRLVVSVWLGDRDPDPEVAALRQGGRVGPQVPYGDLDLDILFDLPCLVVKSLEDRVLA